MSIMHDFMFQILAQQRHDEFVAAAANDRLVRIARSGRPSWRERRLTGSMARLWCGPPIPRARPKSTGYIPDPPGRKWHDSAHGQGGPLDGRRTSRPSSAGGAVARLHEMLDEVVADGSRFVLIGGDAGSGKTTVVEAFAADLFDSLADRKAQLIRGQCVPMGGEGLPYAPIVGALRDLIAQHGRDQVLDWAGAGAPALGVLLPDLAGLPAGGDSLRLQLFEAITMLWERASEQGPLVVIMEDIHWADESTRHLLRFLARALTDAPVMIITTYRTDELTRRHPLRPFLAEVGRLPGTVRVDLPNLDRAEVAELLTQLLDRPPSNVVIDLVYRRSEGIPYFVEELTRSASARLHRHARHAARRAERPGAAPVGPGATHPAVRRGRRQPDRS